MSIAPGALLGPYEITAKLGEGGMGVVFQAKDFQPVPILPGLRLRILMYVQSE